ncbi:hypothetical protein G4H71_16940 [Rhodococcus triatomae]|uniref:Excreted virulence factor EspC, type VII ESX diderm n=1 Tax=Rhodococcus triatomae TaxID=300028 RepID=A0A1G8R5Z9_9NOCA|nr:hypothetical protein [Rhodococcus triatomae]QNG19585.1 hypothetical protein G4H72_13435 [Rhodococcus triatomae]QNG24500.1 hypothetical protein G4H71_16940 [Rhodococcus triatomae]SDJ12402.1 hypothetical protein SAMN05444695_11717 [Rhodococcus triatomae]
MSNQVVMDSEAVAAAGRDLVERAAAVADQIPLVGGFEFTSAAAGREYAGPGGDLASALTVVESVFRQWTEHMDALGTQLVNTAGDYRTTDDGTAAALGGVRS